MVAQITVKLTNRSPKRPIKNLPGSIEVSPETTVQDVKAFIARQVNIKDHNRIGLFDPATNKTLKNRLAQIGSEDAIKNAGTLLVKDLGVQMGWRTVFVIEYLGAIVFHLAIMAFRPYLYKNGSQPLSQAQWLSFAFFMLHFFKREFETVFVHRFSASTMPARNIVKNSAFYWIPYGLCCAYEIYAPWSLAAKADGNKLLLVVGSAIFFFCEIANARIHLYLSSLRSPGGTERQIPKGHGFSIVTCPNYTYEILAWVGVIIVSRSVFTAISIAIGAVQMFFWAQGKERAYRKEFPDKYKKKKYVLIPGIC